MRDVQKTHSTKGKSFCTCGESLPELSAENTKFLKRKTAQVTIRLSGLQRRSRTRGLTRHLSQEAQDHPTAKHRVQRAQKEHFGGLCREMKKRDADDRKCMQETDRTYETMDSWGEIARGPRKNHTITAGALWEPVVFFQTTAGGSNTIPTRQHPELGQAHRARLNCQSAQRVTGSQAGSSCTQAQ